MNLNWIDFIPVILATYRLARMLGIEEGPFGIFQKVRDKIDPKQKTWLGRGLNCPLCIGMWAALAMLGLWQLQPWGVFVVCWLAIAGAQVIIQQVTG